MAEPEVAAEIEEVALRPRDVRFDWSRLPMHWVPGEPFATHVINVLHLLLPEGEEWFVRVFRQAVPLIEDDKLREDVLGFIGQEAMHAKSHQGVLDHFDTHGLDTRDYTGQIGYLFKKVLGDKKFGGQKHSGQKHSDKRREQEWLIERVALIAGIEHITAFLGQWILDARALDDAGADPTMLDLLRWHGAEEVEHRSVAFDLYQHLDGRHFRRIRMFLLAAPFFLWLWVRGVRYLMAHDPVLGGTLKPRWRDLMRTGKRGLTPGYRETLRLLAPYFRRSYHPSQDGSTSQAIAYLANSPAAQAAEH
jgi:predicted metal-dependent hydrolase